MDGFAGVAGLIEAAGAGANGAAPPDGVSVAGRPAGIAALLADDATRAELRRRIEETTQSLRGIAAGFGISQASLARAVADEGWTRPEGAPVRHGGVAKGSRGLARDHSDAEKVQGRLLRAVDRQTLKIEHRLAKAGAAIEEKDARVLVHLARTLGILMALDRGHGATAEPERQSRDDEDRELARRIAEWAQGEDE
jgi:hypothetical protein